MSIQVEQVEDINAHSNSEYPAASDDVAVASDPNKQDESSGGRLNGEEEGSPGLDMAKGGLPDTDRTLISNPED